MYFSISKNPKGKVIYLIDNIATVEGLCNKEESVYLKQQFKNEQNIVSINRYTEQIFVVLIKDEKDITLFNESIRKQGAALCHQLNGLKTIAATISNKSQTSNAAFLLAEGMALANYQFLKYKSDAKKVKNSLLELYFDKESMDNKSLQLLQTITDAIYNVRDLVNEPLQYLTAEELSKEITRIGKEGRFKVTVLNKSKIEQLKMGGILAVNSGSILPPTFTIMEHKPLKAKNKNPIVLVGKGIVYDTGGLSLKPTKDSMDSMKSDMSGAALVTGLMYIAGTLDLPLHIIGLVPATENRPGENAYVPGDIITMYDGTTVEVLNTDAEGRLVLADALHYAKKYNPELVMDFATLTGAASAIVGDNGIICMGNVDEEQKNKLKDSGNKQYERLMELPLWNEYMDMIKSPIADLKNIGGPVGGAITAGMFLKHFTDYPWMHFDIAGVAFGSSSKDYRPAGGTGFGVRLITDYLLNYSK